MRSPTKEIKECERERERSNERERGRERKRRNTTVKHIMAVNESKRDACDRSFFFSFCENIINYLKGRKNDKKNCSNVAIVCCKHYYFKYNVIINRREFLTSDHSQRTSNRMKCLFFLYFSRY